MYKASTDTSTDTSIDTSTDTSTVTSIDASTAGIRQPLCSQDNLTTTPRKKSPAGAWRMLFFLIVGRYSGVVDVVAPSRSYTIRSVRKFARILGTDSRRIRAWLLYLEELGYVEGLIFGGVGGRSARLTIRPVRRLDAALGIGTPEGAEEN